MKFKSGDLVHVPANTTLIRTYISGNSTLVEHMVTTVPKNALFIEDSEKDMGLIQYCEKLWLAEKSQISHLE